MSKPPTELGGPASATLVEAIAPTVSDFLSRMLSIADQSN
jgi:hypothetical protein